ncbi:hypothetical protein E2P81_ATG04347 [Venturia nashicola]|nr:hypothetical protein E2P81_ATG04347 [Venturia nashicola]
MDSGPAESASISDPSGKSSLPPMSSMRSLFPGPASKAAPVARHPRLLRWLDIQGCSGGSTSKAAPVARHPRLLWWLDEV